MSWYFGTFNDLFYLNQFDHLIVPNTSLMTLTRSISLNLSWIFSNPVDL